MPYDVYKAAVLQGEGDIRTESRRPTPLRAGQLRLRLAYSGICGTDLHYFRQFGNAGFRLRNAVVLGHEATGIVAELGPEAEGFAIGDKVVVNPVMNCRDCLPCRRGQSNLCEHKRFPGSATSFPHIDGYFREFFEAEARCCIVVPPDSDLAHLALVEPLACSLHGVERAGVLTGRRVLITGAGPIGTLAAAAARAGGAGHVTIADINDEPLQIACRMGAHEALNTRATPLVDVVGRDGPFDVTIEASGASSAFLDCIASLRRGGTMIQLGIVPSEVPCPVNQIMLKEVTLHGSSQFTDEFDIALRLLQSGQIDAAPMLTHRFCVSDAAEAFAVAADRRKSMKVLIVPDKEKPDGNYA